MSARVPHLVVFTKGDPSDCKNWPDGKKALVTLQVCFLAFAAVFGSSIYAAAVLQLTAKYKVGDTVVSLGLSGYVLGFSFGPLVWGKFYSAIVSSCSSSQDRSSERNVRQTLAVPFVLADTLACAPSAYVNNLGAIISFRFVAGCCAGCALNNGGGVLTDMYMADMQAQTVAIALYAASVFAGPCIALPVGFFIAANTGPDLWVLRVYFFFVATLLPVAFLLPETHGPTILAMRSEEMRRRGIPNARAAHELQQRTTKEFLQLHIGRPFSMFLREPVIQAAAVWTSLAYGITYLFFEVYPVVFYEHYSFSYQLTGLPFLAMVLGFLAAIALNQPLVRLFIRMPLPFGLQTENPSLDSPEAKLKLSLFACVLMPASLFWFAWTSSGEVHWIVPTLAGVPFGFSAITIFFVFLTYIAETYTIYANSANVCNTFCRSTVAAIFPLVASSLIKTLGTKWGVSLFAFLSLGLIPIPLVFLRYGATIRARSHYAQEAAWQVAQMRSGSGTGSALNRIPSSAQERDEQARREVHVSLSLASMRTAGTTFSDSGTLIDGPPKSVLTDPIDIRRGGMESNEAIELTRMEARRADFPNPPLR